MPLSGEGTASRSGSEADPRPKECAYLFCAFRAADDGSFEPSRHSLSGVDRVAIGRAAAPSIERTQTGLNLRFVDPWLSGSHATLSLDHARYVLRDVGSRNHSFVNGVQVETAVLEDGDVLELGNHFFVFRHAVLGIPGELPDVTTATLGQREPLLTLSPSIGRTFSRILAAATTELTVCLGGETGTGKEIVARTIHERSGRTGAFVAVNCAAISPSLIESELFGYRKGAFSGATEHRTGLIRSADRGTLFLDEIGDMPLAAQAALLRVLQEREVLPVGGTEAIAVDLRVIVATHKDLSSLVEQGLFRADLHARLLGLAVTLRALRERKEDLGLLFRTLLKRHFHQGAPAVGLGAARHLFSHNWPFNIRELDRRTAAAAALASSGSLEAEHLLFEEEAPGTERIPRAVTIDDGATQERPLATLTSADEGREAWLRGLLEAHDWNISAVARASGKARSQIQRWMTRFRLRR